MFMDVFLQCFVRPFLTDETKPSHHLLDEVIKVQDLVFT